MCKVDLRAHKSDLLKHASSSENKAAVRAAAARKNSTFQVFLSQVVVTSMGVRRKKCRGGQKHSRDGHLSESYSQVSVSDRVTN